jgi:heme oxygenase
MTYFHIYGEGMGQAWRDFTRALDEYGRSHREAWAAISDAAWSTFDAVDTTLATEAGLA